MKNTKFYISQKSGSAYWLDSMNEIHQIPMSSNHTFSLDDEDCIVETWDECPEEEMEVKKALGAEM